MAKFKAGQGAGRGDANGGCAGAAEQGEDGGVCVLSPCAALSTQKPPYREAMTAKCSWECWGHWWYWEEFGLLGG